MKKKKKKAQLPFRLNILFFIVFLLFCGLILQLGVVQILNGEEFKEEVERTIKDTTKIPVPRGLIFDRNHEPIVENKPEYSITYTPAKGVQAEDKLKVAEQLAKYISMDSDEELDSLTDRDKKEYWYLKHTDEADARLSEEEAAKMKNAKQYDTILKRITDEEISDFTKEELEVIVIKKELDKAYSLTPQVIKNENVTAEEYARVAENLDKLPGVNATTDWNRDYPFKNSLKSILGAITSQKEGLPAEKLDYFLSRGYSRNDRVGKSGLEKQYEDVLRGRKEQVQYTTTKTGKVIDSKVVVPGQRGKDLVLTIDMDLQKKVDDIVKKELEAAIKKHPHANRFMNDALAVVMDPQTGELLAVSGQHYNKKKNKYENVAYKTLYDAHRPGSSVKGASVLAGYASEAISPGQSFYDAPIQIAGTPEKSSWKNLGNVDDISALTQSSNVYMFYIAMRMGGEYNYERNKAIKFDPEAFQTMRYYFHQFGLGAETGIDYPYESTGYVGQTPQAGNLMDFAIGQYDTYTTMQLAQYVSTVASGGYRVQPHFVKEILSPDPDKMGPVYKSINTKVLNRVDMSEKEIKRVQQGFRGAFQNANGTASQYFKGKSYDPAGKTGTAQNEVYEDGKHLADTENLTLVGYAPYDDPEVAFAVVVPNTGQVSNQHPINNLIGEGILDAYFDLKKDRDEGKTDD